MLFTILLAAAAWAAPIAADATLGGKWQIHTSVSGSEDDSTCTFLVKDEGVTGECATQRGTVQLTGKVDGSKVTWTYKSEYNGTPLTVTFRGTLEPEKMKGSVTVPEFGVEGEFTGVQAK